MIQTNSPPALDKIDKFYFACKNEDVDSVKKLLASKPPVESFAIVKGFTDVCISENGKMVDFLLGNPISFAAIKENPDEAILKMCINGSTDSLMKTFDALPNGSINIHYMDNLFIKSAISWKNTEIADFLIFKLDIEYTKDLQHFLEFKKEEEYIKKFNYREMNKNIPHTEKQNQKYKI